MGDVKLLSNKTCKELAGVRPPQTGIQVFRRSNPRQFLYAYSNNFTSPIKNMPTKKLFTFTAISFLIIVSAVLVAKAVAQETTNAASIQYPVTELGNCPDKAACKLYCDSPENIEACLSFAEKKNLMTKGEIATAKKFTAANVKKPGNCASKNSCEEYCNDINRIDECVAFAQENNLLPPEKLAEAKKVQTAIAQGIKPPACGNKKDCDTYCDSPEHMEECMLFAMEAGIMSEQEKTDSQKMLAAVKRGIKPPPCHGQAECDEYCGQPNNMETCMSFAMEAGLMSEQEKASSQKIIAAVKKGAIPPKCKGKECDVYCGQEEHFEECLSFSEAAGLMNPEEAAMARKTGGKGPGGCKGKDECDAFCNNPDNQETCFNFAKDNGMIPEQDLKRMEQGKQQFKQSLNQAPQAVLDCLNSQMGSEMLEKLKSGQFMPPKDIGDKMQICFEQGKGEAQPGGPGEGGIRPPAGQTGPGGCKTLEECSSYCESNQQECQNFQKPNGPQDQNGQPGQNIPQGPNGAPGSNGQSIQAGPGGCKGPEECKNYCESNPEECKNFQGQQIQPQIEKQIQQQIQNQMAPSQPCQGEGCNYGPPPAGQATDQQPQQQQYQQYPPTGTTPYPGPTPQPTPYSGGQSPTTQQAPSLNQPQPQQYPQYQQPQQYQQTPQTQQYPQPQPYQQPPQQLQQPTPDSIPNAPPPSSFLSPETFLGSILTIFNLTFGITK